MSDDGNLVLLNKFKISVWCTTIASKSTIAMLLYSGNFVIRGLLNSSIVCWQSFDHPTDTWLPGQWLVWKKITKEYMTFTSWRSPDNPSLGLYSFGVDSGGMNQTVQSWNGSEIYWTGMEWNGQFFSLIPEMTASNLYPYSFAESEDTSLTHSDTSFLTRSVADVSGKMLQWSQPRMPCDVYSICGVFSVCDNDRAQLCGCPQDFKPSSQNDWDSKYFQRRMCEKNPSSVYWSRRDGQVSCDS